MAEYKDNCRISGTGDYKTRLNEITADDLAKLRYYQLGWDYGVFNWGIKNNITKLDYAQSNGTQAIDTGVIFENGIEIDIRFNLLDTDGDVDIISSSNNDNILLVSAFNGSGRVFINDTYTDYELSANTIYTFNITYNNNQLIVKRDGLIVAKMEINNIRGNSNLFLFARNSIYGFSKARIYYCRIKKGNINKTIIPVYTEGETCFIDIQNQKLLKANDLILGNIVNGFYATIIDNSKVSIDNGLMFAYGYFGYVDKCEIDFIRPSISQYYIVYAELDRSKIPNTCILKVKNNQSSTIIERTFRQDYLDKIKTGIFQLPLWRVKVGSNGIEELFDLREFVDKPKQVQYSINTKRVVGKIDSGVTAVTQPNNDNSNKIATTLFVHNATRHYIDN